MAAVTWSAKKSSALPAPVVIVGMFTGSGATTVANTNLASVVGKSYKAVLARVKFTGELEKTIVLDGGKSAVVVLGLGDPKKLTFESLRRASAAAARAVACYPTAVAAYGNAAASVLSGTDVARAMYEGLALGSYSYSTYKKSNAQVCKKITISEVDKTDDCSVDTRNKNFECCHVGSRCD